jgi:hypothetical protein
MNIIKYKNTNIKVVKSKRYKYMRLSVSSGGEIKLSLPSSILNHQIKNFLNSNDNWLQKALNKVKPARKLSIQDETEVSILGEPFKIELKEFSVDKNKCYIDAANHKIYLFVKENTSQTTKRILIKGALIDYAREKIEEKTREIAQTYEISYKRISIRDQKTRWGSCSSAGNLNFNWKIILAPKQIFDYVIAHELAHLVEHNHSQNFWNLVKKIHPTHKEDRRWLKLNGKRLDIL